MRTGLCWLSRHQSQDGSWSAAHFDARCKGASCKVLGMQDFDVGVTGLALLALLGAGHTPSNRATYKDPVTGASVCYGDVVRKGLKFLVDQQGPDGQIGPSVCELMYNHTIATFALCEAYGITNAVCYRAPAQRAVEFLEKAQNFGLGWRYTPHCGNNDTSVTGWVVMALKSAQISGLDISQTAYDGALTWLKRVTESNGRVGYDKLGSAEAVAMGKTEDYACHPAMTAVSLLSRTFIERKRGDAALAQAAKIVAADPPRWDTEAKQGRPGDSYYWYYGTYALNQWDGPTGPLWKEWNKTMGDVLCKTQCTKKDGCADGSWPAEHDKWAYAGGRVYTTAMNCLTLEVYYRYANVFGGSERATK